MGLRLRTSRVTGIHVDIPIRVTITCKVRVGSIVIISDVELEIWAPSIQ